MEKLLGVYESFLSSLNLDVDQQGLISMKLGDERIPAECDDRRLILPTRDNLRHGLPEGTIAFHPLSESISRGQSKVLKKTRMLVNLRLSTVLSVLLTELMDIAADPSRHEKVAPSHKKFLKLVPDVDAKTVKALTSVLDATSPTGTNRLVNVYLKRGGELRGQHYKRTARVSFPITEQFENEEPVIFGVKMRKKDKRAIEQLFYWIVPGADDITEYSRGSNAAVAPYFDALLEAYREVAWHLNKVTKKFKKHLDDADELYINLDWVDDVEDLEQYRSVIPVLEGNDGETDITDHQDESAIPDKAAAPAPIGGELKKDPRAERSPGGLPKLGKPLGERTYGSGTARPSLARPNALETAGSDEGEDEDWQTFVARRNTPRPPQFGAAPAARPGPSFAGGGYSPPAQAGYPPQGGMAPQQPAPTFRAVGESAPAGHRGGGGRPHGGVSSV